MPSSPAETIKEKLDIVEFLKGYLTLAPAGRNFKALCPFHKEKTPSFMVSPERQSWKCFGCNLGGDIFAFLMRYENLEFGEALRTLAEKAGVELKRLNPAEYKYIGLLYDINDLAKVFFKKQLAGAPAVLKYLAERGLKPETIEEFEVGFAPNEPEALTVYLVNAGYSTEDLVRAGVALRTERGMKIDRFRGRIMFPIHNHLGKVVGFSGRILPSLEREGVGKYVNSPESPIFQKSKILYGFFKAKDAIREKGVAFLVEGQMDFLMSWQAGIKNVVATSGTALTPDHLKTLKRLTSELVIAFDSDEAGLGAGERAIDLAQGSDFTVKAVIFGEYKDPAEAVKGDPKGFALAVKQARPAPEFYFEKYLKSGTAKIVSRRELQDLRAVLAKLLYISSPVERSSWIKELAVRTGIAERALTEEAAKLELKPAQFLKSEKIEPLPQKKFSRLELLSQQLLAAALAKNDFAILQDCESCLAPGCLTALAILKKGERESDDPAIDEIIDAAVFKAGALEAEEIEDLKQHLVREHVKARRREITAVVREAESAGDEKKLKAALEEFNQLKVS